MRSTSGAVSACCRGSATASCRACSMQRRDRARDRSVRNVGRPACRVPKKSPGPRSAQIALRDLEAVGRLGHRLQTRSRLLSTAATGTAGSSTTGALRARRGRAAGAAATGRSARRARSIITVAFGTSMPTSTTVVDTRICSSPRGERPHHAIFGVLLHPAVQQRRRGTRETRPARGDRPSPSPP